MSAHLIRGLGLAFLLACDSDEIIWAEFSREASVEVFVESADACDARLASTEAPKKKDDPNVLRSAVVGDPVGEIMIEPICGPVGTVHNVEVTVFEDFEDIVRRATLTVDATVDDPEEGRGEETFEMDRDAAFPGRYGLELQSQGVEGETRTDLFRFLLLSAEELTDVVEEQ